MARKPRFTILGVPQHVIQRGHNREPCFFSEMDYRRYLDVLQEVANHNRCHVHAWVLMTNHVHLLVTPFGEHGVSHMTTKRVRLKTKRVRLKTKRVRLD